MAAMAAYFSQVDNVVLGCGTKLPHNVTVLLGVMDGAASDLSGTGLPLQMIEVHEPVRLLNIIETTPEAMLQILARTRASPGCATTVGSISRSCIRIRAR